VSHIHIPDGVLPFWLWAGGWAAALVIVFAAGRYAERAEVRRKVPLLAVVSALMLVAMSSEIVPIAYHINLTVVGGVLLGPALSVIAAFIAEVVLAMLGHGGVTVLGLNTLIVSTEMILGWALFHAFVRVMGRRRVGWSGAIATVLTLATTTTMLVGIVALAGGGAATSRESGALDPSTLKFENPFAAGVFSAGLFAGGQRGTGGSGESSGAGGKPTAGGGGAPTSGGGSAASTTDKQAVRRFAAVVYTLGPFGWLIEALVTAGILGYVSRVRPALIWEGALAHAEPRVPGHESRLH
jgi:ABC-type Co2+ transport system permease subunit